MFTDVPPEPAKDLLSKYLLSDGLNTLDCSVFENIK